MKQSFLIILCVLCGLCERTALAALQIDNAAVSNITTTAAAIYGTVTSTNGSGTNSVILYYGTTDSSNSAAGWASSNVYASAVTNLAVGTISTNIAGLTPTTLYYYRWYLLEGTNSDWAASTSNFWTLAGVPTNAAPAAPYRPLMVSTSGAVVAPTNFFDANGIPDTNDTASLQSQISSNDGDIAALQSGVLYTSGTYTSWTNAGGTYTQETVFTTSPLLTNGFASISYDEDGWSVVAEMSSDSNTWSAAMATNTAVYLRLRATNAVPPGETSLVISNIVASSWTKPSTWGTTSDTIGQILLVDTPTTARQPATKAYADAAAAAVTPAAWAQYEASTDVNLSGHRLIMTDEWTLTQTGGVGIISYADISATTNELSIAHNGIAIITAASGITGLHIDDFTIAGSNVTLWVSTNGVVSAPLPQYAADLLTPSWATLGSYTSTYPTVTNDAYKIEFTLPAGDTGFFRAVQQSGVGSVNIGVALTVQGASPWQPQSSTNDAPTLIAPRWVGDELIIYDTTQVVYRAFGSTTNDWVSIWP